MASQATGGAIVRIQANRVGLIGVGRIAEWRVPALRAAGLEVTAVSTRPESQRLHDFATRHRIARVFDDWRAMIEHPEQWDALVISTWPDGTPQILAAALELNIPILVEKPVAWSSARLIELCAKPHERVIVGYNRRFYHSVQAAHAQVQEGSPLIAQLTLPAEVIVPDEPEPAGHYMKPFFESVSALGIDLTRFVLGNLRIEAVQRLMTPSGNLAGLVALLRTDRGDLLQLTANWGVPANFSLSLNRPDRRFDLLPFEIATIYEGMDVLQPTDEYPIRRYTPKLVKRINLDGIDLQEKPGFVGEAQALRAMIAGDAPPVFAARLEDALAVTRLCEELTGVRFSQ
jgi:predicted dehydrogenase